MILVLLDLLVGREHDVLERFKLEEDRHQVVTLLIELGTLLVQDDLLVVHNTVVGLLKHGDEEVEHDYEHDEVLDEPHGPDEYLEQCLVE